MRRLALFCVILSFSTFACKKKEKGKASTSAKVRTTGVSDDLTLSLMAKAGFRGDGDGDPTNSYVELESLKVPIFRVNLVSGLVGTGYTDSSPNFYTCDGETPDDCLVDLVDDSLKDLIDNTRTVEVDSDADYNGVAVEFCGDGSMGKTYNVYVKGKVLLGNDTYYTNEERGLSKTGPAEETGVPIACHGFTTPLPEPVTLGPDKTVNIVLWADPNGMAQARFSSDGEFGDDCIGSSEENAAMCASFTTIFATVDDSQPEIERYILDVEGDGPRHIPYSDLLMTVLFNSDDTPIAGGMTPIFPNTEAEDSYGAFAFSQVTKAKNDTLTFNGFNGDSRTIEKLLSGFPRETSPDIMTIVNTVGDEIEFISTKL